MLACTPTVPSCITSNQLLEALNPVPIQELAASTIAELRNNVLYLFAEVEGRPGYGRGSGVILFDQGEWTVVLTAWHLFWTDDRSRKSRIKLATQVMVSSLPEREEVWIKAAEGKVSCFDAQHDLAVVIVPSVLVRHRFDIPSPLGVKLYGEDPPIGMEMITINNSEEFDRILSKGVVSGYMDKCPSCLHPRSLLFDGYSWMGGSGGPGFSMDGKLVGILSRTTTTGIRLLVPPSVIGDFLMRCRRTVQDEVKDDKTPWLVEVTEHLNKDHFILGSPRSLDPTWTKPEVDEGDELDEEEMD